MAKGEIFIYDIIGTDWWTGEGMTAKKFMDQLRTLNNDTSIDSINVRINSPGGSISEGIAIFNAIQRNEKPIHTVVDGIAYSMGALIALSGKTVSMAKNATMLLHNCLGVAVGNVRDMRQTIELMDKIDTGISESIAEKTGLTIEEVKAKWMNYDDHTLTAREALDAGLVDEVLDYTAEVAAGIENMSTTELYALYANKNGRGAQSFMDQIISKVTAKLQGTNTPSQSGDKKNTIMFGNKFSKLSALKGKKAEDVTEEILNAVNEQLRNEGVEHVTVVADAILDSMSSEVSTLTQSVTDITNSRDEWKQKAESYGQQPGAMPSNPDKGADTIEDTNEWENAIANLPHNKVADNFTSGK